ncbi:alpha/beta fold hydrolase [Mangrovivirga sp. M17]|uniref:Alpha/beta fold hydrolase n=1 Tax=Mangrovivirga halotolerans TaxID=2993936 RepID=A0ABT3RP16_9BACT|nr:alpha/beta fold hydrolase [Mangrovivirga halotolerans]MCX2743109.1 alpha/beta fold hydrolase [Mangrovivirga halotolerans]
MKKSRIVKFSFDNYLAGDDYKIYYKIIGEGHPLLIIHGGPVLDHSYMIDSFSSLGKEFKLIFFDQCACGKSTIPQDHFQLDMNNLLKDIDAILENADENNVSILGHSWGGFLGLNYTLNFPEKVKSLILSNPMPLTRDQWNHDQRVLDERILKSDLIKRNKVLQSDQMRKNPSLAIKKLMKISFKPHFSDENMIEKLNLQIPEDYLKRSELYEYLMNNDLGDYNLEGKVNNIHCPVLTIYGDAEPAVKSKYHHVIDKAFQNSHLKIIKNSGHFPFIENPSSYFTAVKKFLSKITV